MENQLNLTGQKFGHLTIMCKADKKAKSGSMWICKCDCGNVITVTRSNLKSGNTMSCGCQTHALSQETRRKNGFVKDLTGQKFGLLEVIQKSTKRSGTNPMWECLCACGNHTVVIQENLLNGHTRSCGCMRFDIGSQSLTHGLSNTRLYHIWRGMIARCKYPSQDSYHLYGGRGISVCEEWRNNFVSFYNWAIDNGYDPEAPFGKCTIDRIDVNGNYEPTNCRWVDMGIQAKNKRNR